MQHYTILYSRKFNSLKIFIVRFLLNQNKIEEENIAIDNNF